MKSGNFVWKEMYRFTEPGINAEGVRVYPFDHSFPIDVGFHRASGSRLVRLNRHEFFEIIYMYSGKTNIQVRDRILHAQRRQHQDAATAARFHERRGLTRQRDQ